MSENIQHRLGGMENGAPRSTEGTHRWEQQHSQPKDIDVQEKHTDNVEEDQGLSTTVRKRDFQAWNSHAHQQWQPSASYYTQVRSHQVHQIIEHIHTGYEYDSSSEDD